MVFLLFTLVAKKRMLHEEDMMHDNQKNNYKTTEREEPHTVTLAEGNFSARNLVLTPTEQPISKISLIVEPPEY